MGLKEGYRNYNYIREYGGERFDDKYLILFYETAFDFKDILMRLLFVLVIVRVFVINRINVSIFRRR